MEDSIFTKVYKGEIPGEIIYKDDVCFVMLTIQPQTPGHMLVIPIEQIDHLWDVSDETYHHLFNVVKQMKQKLNTAYPDYKRVGLIVEGFGVPHAHIHVFGYEQPLEETLIEHKAWKEAHADSPFASSDELHDAAEKLRSA